MSNRPTPETDAAWAAAKELRHENGSPAHGWAAMDMCNFARERERERDSYAAKLVASEAYEAGLLAERDEAREQLEAMREAIKEASEAILYLLMVSTGYLKRSGDKDIVEDARAALTKLQPFLK